MNQALTAKLKVLTSMFIFGTIGLFVRSISLSSSGIALVRGVIGTLFLALIMLLLRKKPDLREIRSSLLALLFSGAALGFNWILLFESYRFTTVATSTLCYYLAPTIVVLASPIVFREKLTVRKLLCAAAALLGMVLVSGLAELGLPAPAEARGILFGIGAAVLYACVVIINKKMSGLSPYDRTVMQLAISALVLTPYCLLTGAFAGANLDLTGVLLLIFVGVVHTGLTYFLYFGASTQLHAQTLAIFSYIDPVVAVLLSMLILHEPLSPLGMVGAVLILGAALISELPARKSASKSHSS